MRKKDFKYHLFPSHALALLRNHSTFLSVIKSRIGILYCESIFKGISTSQVPNQRWYITQQLLQQSDKKKKKREAIQSWNPDREDNSILPDMWTEWEPNDTSPHNSLYKWKRIFKIIKHLFYFIMKCELCFTNDLTIVKTKNCLNELTKIQTLA